MDTHLDPTSIALLNLLTEKAEGLCADPVCEP